MTDFIQPPKRFPFREGEAILHLPSTHRMTSPPPIVRGIVLTAGGIATYIQREDGSRAAVSTTYLAYRSYCQHCYASAVQTTRGHLICAGCGGPVIDEPPPDEMVVLRFPVDYFGWYVSMAMRRAIINPTWTWKQAIVDRDETINRAYQRMLRRLGLEKPVYRNGQDGRIAEHLKYYAMLDHEAAFLATYFQLTGQAVTSISLAA